MGTGDCFSRVRTCNKSVTWSKTNLGESSSTIYLSPSYCGNRIQGRADFRESFIRTLPLSAFIFSQGDLIQSQNIQHQPPYSYLQLHFFQTPVPLSPPASLPFLFGYLIDSHPNLCKHFRSFYSTSSSMSWLTRTPFFQLLRPNLATLL